MENIERDFEVKYDLDWAYIVEIKQIRDDLDALEKLGATHIEIQTYVSYDCANLTIEAMSRRVETDEEYLERVGRIKNREEETKRFELAQLQKLKDKYPTN